LLIIIFGFITNIIKKTEYSIVFYRHCERSEANHL